MFARLYLQHVEATRYLEEEEGRETDLVAVGVVVQRCEAVVDGRRPVLYRRLMHW